MGRYDYILAKSDGTPLKQHLIDVARVAETIARHVGRSPTIAVRGAHLHDIGKTSPAFQQRLRRGAQMPPGSFFRHEIASLFFLSLIDDSRERDCVIEMIVAHHKSIIRDQRGLGLLDLDECNDPFDHLKGWSDWSPAAIGILDELGWKTHPISLEEATDNLQYAIDYCRSLSNTCSLWKGLLMAADHFASAMQEKTGEAASRLFISPDLTYYGSRQSDLYPLSLTAADSEKPHTIVVAPTGAGKTDFLLRRCRGRVFYTLPFQASINAMYDRFKTDLAGTEAQIYPLHAAIALKLDNHYEYTLSHLIGSSIKVLTPYQLASIAFGLKGYESIVLDLKGCDVILDEIHTYAKTAQAMVLKIVEILIPLGCRIHIGSATMPTVLYHKLYELLGGDQTVYEVKLKEQTLQSFDRHIIHKISCIEEAQPIIDQALQEGQKVLVVCNQVRLAQETFRRLTGRHPQTPAMLIHSRFRRQDRAQLESDLRERYNHSSQACLVVSTQVVEVSLDISFDLMVTECAPLDALIQRFGRINRRRTADTIGHFKPVYVIAPPSQEEGSKALPYDWDILNRSYQALPDGELLREEAMQQLLDSVYPDITIEDIDWGSAFNNGQWTMKSLKHAPRSALFDLVDFDSILGVLESDYERYLESPYRDRSRLEIPLPLSTRFKDLKPIDYEALLLIPDSAYDPQLGYLAEQATPHNYHTFEIL